MKQLLVWFLLLISSLHVWAQPNATAVKYATLLNPEGAKKHLSILASDAFEGRETGTRGAQLAASYIAKEFKKLGLKAPVNGSYFQKVELVETRFVVDKFQVNGEHFHHNRDFYISGSANVKKIKAREIVFAGYGISTEGYDDLQGIDIAGKVVLVMGAGEPQRNGAPLISRSAESTERLTSRLKRIQNLRAKNPALILMVNPEVLLRSGGHSSSGSISLKKKSVISIPVKVQADVIEVTSEVADAFLKRSGRSIAQLQSAIDETAAPMSQSLKADIEIFYGNQTKDVKASNVLGYLEGSDLKNELLVVSAHYDHVGMNPTGADRIFNGADDDGSGTTAVLELAKVFSKAKKDNKGPRRSILFLAVVGEEKGLLGSQWYSEDPVFPLASTVANLNIDMIGRVDPSHKDNPDYCYLIGSDKLSTQLHAISERANATYTKLQIDYKYNDPKDPERIYYRSDHYNFAKHGIPIIFYFNGVHEDYHKVSDEIEKINFPLLTRRAQLVFYTAWDIVNRDERPVVDVKDNMPKSR